MLCAVVKSVNRLPSNLIVYIWHIGPIVHKYHISGQLSFKTFKFGYTILTIFNGIVSNV